MFINQGFTLIVERTPGTANTNILQTYSAPDPLMDPKHETPKYEPITTLGKLGGYWEVPCFGDYSCVTPYITPICTPLLV